MMTSIVAWTTVKRALVIPEDCFGEGGEPIGCSMLITLVFLLRRRCAFIPYNLVL